MRVERGWAYPDADTHMAEAMADDGTYQGSHLAKALEYVTDWTYAIDGGAHVGQFAKPMAALFTAVIAVEPAADSVACLEANLQHFGVTNVTIKPVALGAHTGGVSLELDAKQSARGNTGGRYVVAGGSIPVERIDDWHLSNLGFLKLDVEGSELAALHGATATLQRCRPVVLFESKGFGRRYGHATDAPQTFLNSLGFRELARVGCDLIWGPT